MTMLERLNALSVNQEDNYSILLSSSLLNILNFQIISLLELIYNRLNTFKLKKMQGLGLSAQSKENQVKRCKGCGLDKDDYFFGINERHLDGLATFCDTCANQKSG